MSESNRAERAIAAACDVAGQWGLTVVQPVVIADSNNTIVDLHLDRGGTIAVVAKVATALPEPDGGSLDDPFDRELAVLRHLHGRGAPSSSLSDLLPHGPHVSNGCRLFFLDRLDIVGGVPDRLEALEALTAVHAALSTFTGDLPTFGSVVAHAASLFRSVGQTSSLPDAERSFCLAAGDEIGRRLATMTWEPVVLHGDPWTPGNVVVTPRGVRLLDFEAVCTGPIEWDLSALGDVADAAEDVDTSLFQVCRLARSFVVAALCWARPGRAPEVDVAAREHLGEMHRRLDP